MIFRVPEGAEVDPKDREKAIRMLRKFGGRYADLPDDANFTRQGSSCWFTNIEHGVRHEWLELDTAERNQTKVKARKVIRERGYPKFDNYEAIEVSFTDAIPSDHDGVMGVPISFLDKYNPEQFEIVGLAAGNIQGLAGIPSSTGKDGPYIDGKLKYGRIFIRNRRPESVNK